MNIKTTLTSKELVSILRDQCRDCDDDWRECDGVNWVGPCEIHKYKAINPTHSRCGNRRDIIRDIQSYCRTCAGIAHDDELLDCKNQVCKIRLNAFSDPCNGTPPKEAFHIDDKINDNRPFLSREVVPTKKQIVIDPKTWLKPMRLTGGLTLLTLFRAFRTKCFECKPGIPRRESFDGVKYPLTQACECYIAHLVCVNPYADKVLGATAIDALIAYCGECKHSNEVMQCDNPECVFMREVYDHPPKKQLEGTRRVLRENLTVDEILQTINRQCEYCGQGEICNGLTSAGVCPIHERLASRSIGLLVRAIEAYCKGACGPKREGCGITDCQMRPLWFQETAQGVASTILPEKAKVNKATVELKKRAKKDLWAIIQEQCVWCAGLEPEHICNGVLFWSGMCPIYRISDKSSHSALQEAITGYCKVCQASDELHPCGHTDCRFQALWRKSRTSK